MPAARHAFHRLLAFARTAGEAADRRGRGGTRGAGPAHGLHLDGGGGGELGVNKGVTGGIGGIGGSLGGIEGVLGGLEGGWGALRGFGGGWGVYGGHLGGVEGGLGGMEVVGGD